MPRTQLVDGLGAEVGESLKMCLGGKLSLAVKGEGWTLTNVRWTVGGWGNAVSGYTPTDDKAEAPAFASYAGTSIAFFWAKTGKFAVTVEGKASGQFFRNQTSVTVAGPEVVSFESVTDEVKLATIDSPTGIGTSLALSFGGDRTDQTPGILTTATVVAPACAGKFMITQLMTINRTVTQDSGALQLKSSEGKYVLDEDVAYGFTSGDDDDEKKTVSCAGGASVTMKHEDSPASVLSRVVSRGEVLSSVEAREDFRTYVMYKPTGGVWVAVAKLEWYWQGKATWNVGQARWVLSGEDWSRNPTGTLVTEHPLWAKNRYSIM